MGAVEPFFPLLALCARAQGHPVQAALLRKHAQALQQWDDLPAQAEAHGLVPLLFTHLEAAGVAMPPAIKQQLLGYYMQHAHATRVRTQVLADILTCYQAAGIDVLLLKGAALAQLVYPQPVLRPMRDIDILVRAEDVYHAYALLPEIGFTPPPGAHHGLGPDHHDLTAIKRAADGFSVSVEVHHALHLNERGHPLRYNAYVPTAQSFTVGSISAQTLGREETLWHIYRHTLSHGYPVVRERPMKPGRASDWPSSAPRVSGGYYATASFPRRGGCGCIMGKGHHALATCGHGWRTSAGCWSRSAISLRGRRTNSRAG